ncbi:MAG: NADPH-dependent glutamate synthase [Planctomycetia bacterium]|nr:NADPH-dependent glutamate synthase [Planctomycetia bacterium]
MGKKLRKTKVEIPCQDGDIRRANFLEVALGYSADMAREEAERCIQCKDKPCVAGCPVEIEIPAFIELMKAGKFGEAAAKIKEKNALPAICGRVCPQEDQCEAVCTLAKKFDPVGIGRLERFAADWEAAQELASGKSAPLPAKAPATGRRVACVGAGPASLTVAGDLVLLGHEVTVFEALHEPGGVLVYGIPEFRLPKAIVKREVDYLKRLGVEFRTSVVIGKSFTIDELLGELGYDAVFIATGAGLPHFMKIPGINLAGVYSANEYLTRSNLMKAYDFPRSATPIVRGKKVAVVGGGNTAMDAVRTARRLGAEEARLVYRRSEAEMPARKEEIHHAHEEGVIFMTLTNPTKILGDERGRVKAMECVKQELGAPDASGRRSPVAVAGSEFTFDVDLVVMAVGQGANPMIRSTTPDLECNKWGNIVADPVTMATSKKGVYAGGDIVSGGATVILAMGAGRKAARAIHQYLGGLPAKGTPAKETATA